MATVKRLVCLANSRKLQARCVAGKELLAGRVGSWIRPVSSLPTGEVPLATRRYADGKDPRVMDVIDMPLLSASPHGYQQENWLLDSSQRWVNAGKARRQELSRMLDPVGPLWVNNHSTVNGLHDEIPLAMANALNSSLRLIHVESLTLSVFEYFDKRRVWGRFQHDGTTYRMSVTDHVWEESYKARQDGDYEIGRSFLTISLSEPFERRSACYKLIAAIIEGERP